MSSGPAVRKRGRKAAKPFPPEVVEKATAAIQAKRKAAGKDSKGNDIKPPLTGADLARKLYVDLSKQGCKSGRIRLSVEGWHSSDAAKDEELKTQWNSQVSAWVKRKFVLAKFLKKTENHFDTDAECNLAVRKEMEENPECRAKLKELFNFRPRSSSEKPEDTAADDLFDDMDE